MSTVPTRPQSESAARESTATYSITLPDGRVVLSPAPLQQCDGYLEIRVGDPADPHLRADITLSDGDPVWHCWYPEYEHYDPQPDLEREARIARNVIIAARLTLELNGVTA